MDKIIKILGAITIFFAAILVIDSLGLITNFAKVSDERIEQILEDRFPNMNESQYEYLTDECLLCKEGKCTSFPPPCWKAKTIYEDSEGNLMVAETVMDSGGGSLAETISECDKWWCSARTCVYSVTEQNEGVETKLENYGCNEQLEVCDQEHEKCRDCQEGYECVMEKTVIEGQNKKYEFEVAGTGERAMITQSEGICRISSRGKIIHTQALDIESCKNLIYHHTLCQEGRCDFVPKFDLIQG